MPGGKLQLAQHRRDVALDGLARDEQIARDLLVGVALGDQPQHLALPRGQLVEFRIEGRLDVVRRGRRGEGVKDEAGQPVREHRVAVRDPPDRVREVGGGDRLGDVAPRARPDHRDHVLRGVRGRQREELDLGMLLLDRGDDGMTAAARQVHVEQNHIREEPPDQLDRRGDVVRLADHLHPAAELGAYARAEQAVVVDEQHAGSPGGRAGRRSGGRGAHEPSSLALVGRIRGRTVLTDSLASSLTGAPSLYPSHSLAR
jgi:hypothetical protein